MNKIDEFEKNLRKQFVDYKEKQTIQAIKAKEQRKKMLDKIGCWDKGDSI